MSRARLAGVTATHEGEQVIVLDFASIEVFYAGTLDPITEDIFADATGPTTLTNPFESDADGNFVFYLDVEDEVKLRITHPDAGTFVADNVAVRAPAGTYVVLDQPQTVTDKILSLQDGSVSAPALYFEDEPGANTGWYRSGDGEWSFTVDGTRRLTLKSIGVDVNGRIELFDGSAATPSIQRSAETGDDTGIYFGENQVLFSINGTLKAFFDSLGIDIDGIIKVADGSATNPSITFRSETGVNTGLYRVSEGMIGITLDGVIAFLIASNSIRGVNGSAAAPVFTFINEPDTGLYLEGTNSVGLAVAGAKGLIVLADRSIIPGGEPGAIATSATGPFQYITGMAGVPTGAPTSRASNSQYPVAFDSTNKKLYVQDGSLWKLINSPTIIVAATDAPAAWKAAAGIYLCDGTADQTEINAAITAAGAKGEVVLSPGTFTITAPIVTTAIGQTIRGCGHGVTVIFADNNAGNNATLVSLAHANCLLADLKIDGNKANNAGRTTMRCWGVTAAVCTVRNVWTTGSAGANTTMGSVSGCQIINCRSDSATTIGFIIDSAGLPATLVQGCVSHSNITDGFNIGGTSTNVVGCNSYGNTVHGFQITGGTNVQIVGCSSYDEGQIGFYLSGGSRHGIRSCTSEQAGTYGIHVGVSGCDIVGNTILDASQAIDNTYTCITLVGDDNFISGNLMRQGALANDPAYGIWIQSGSDNNFIGHNDTYDSGQTANILDQGTNNRRVRKIQLDFNAATDLMSSVALTANVWKDVCTNQAFRVNSTTSIIIIHANGSMLAGTSSTQNMQAQIRIAVDAAGSADAPGASNYLIGGAVQQVATTSYCNPLTGGTVEITGLTIGTHQVKIQILANVNATAILLAATAPNLYELTIQVIEVET